MRILPVPANGKLSPLSLHASNGESVFNIASARVDSNSQPILVSSKNQNHFVVVLQNPHEPFTAEFSRKGETTSQNQSFCARLSSNNNQIRITQGSAWVIQAEMNETWLQQNPSYAQKIEAVSNELVVPFKQWVQSAQNLDKPFALDEKAKEENPIRFDVIHENKWGKSGIFFVSFAFEEKPLSFTINPHFHETTECYLLLPFEEKFDITMKTPGKEEVVKGPAAIYIPAKTVHCFDPLGGNGWLLAVFQEKEPGLGHHFIAAPSGENPKDA